MQKRIITLLAIIAFIAAPSFSQKQKSDVEITIKGQVVDSTSRETIPFCTVSVSKYKSPTAPFKRLAADVDGKFEFQVNSKDTIILKFDASGMKSITQQVTDFSLKTIDLGKIKMPENSKMLSEITVTATKPLVKVDLDKITYDMKSDPESTTSSAFDMLRKVPMITIDADDKIQLKGKTNYKIFINGKPSNLTSGDPTTVLKSMPASTIKNIEVITQPGAKYEAEGLSGIINIVTEKAMVGYTASLSAGVDNYGGARGGAYYTTKLGKLGISAGLNYGNYRSPGGTNYNKRINKLTNDSLFQTGRSNNTSGNQYGSLELSYEIDTLNLITLSGSGYGGKYRGKGSTVSYQRANGIENQRYTSNYDATGTYGGYNMNLNYQRSFKKPDQLFTFSYQLDYSPNGSESNSNIIGELNYITRNQKIKSNSGGSEHTFQLDYVEPFNKIHVVDFGVKYIMRINTSANTYFQLDTLTKTWEPLQGTANNDMYQNQNILGAYSDYTLKLDKFSARVGLRLEHTNTKIDFKSDPSQNFKVPAFTNLVPSVRLNYKITDASTMQLGYNQRISRPGIWYLNPFLNNTDPSFVSQGNPNLKTEISNSFDFSYNLFTSKFNFSTNLSTSFTNNSIENTSELRKYDDGKTYQYSTYKNIGISNYNSLYTYLRWQATKKLSLNLNGGASYSIYKTGLKEIGDTKGFNYNVFAGGNYKFPMDFTLNFNGGYSSPSVSLQGKHSPWYYYNLSLSKALLKKKLYINLNASNIFEKFRKNSSYTETSTFRTDNIYNYPSRRIGLSISYRFGEMKEQIKTAQRSITNNDVKSGGGSGGGGGNTGGGGQ